MKIQKNYASQLIWLFLASIPLTIGLLNIFAWKLGYISFVKPIGTSWPLTYPTSFNLILCSVSFWMFFLGFAYLGRVLGLFSFLIGLIFLIKPQAYLSFSFHPNLTPWFYGSIIPPSGLMSFQTSLLSMILGCALYFRLNNLPKTPTFLATVACLLMSISSFATLAFSLGSLWKASHQDILSFWEIPAWFSFGMVLLVDAFKKASLQKPRHTQWWALPCLASLLTFTICGYLLSKELDEKKELEKLTTLSKEVSDLLSQKVHERHLALEANLLKGISNKKNFLASIQGLEAIWKLEKGKATAIIADENPASSLEKEIEDKIDGLVKHHSYWVFIDPSLKTYWLVFSAPTPKSYFLSRWRIENLFSSLSQSSIFKEVYFSIYHHEKSLFSLGPKNSNTFLGADSRFTHFYLPLVVRVWANSPEVVSTRIAISKFILFLGLTFSFVLSICIHFAQMAWQRAKETEQALLDLALSEEFLKKQSVDLLIAKEAALQAARIKSEFLANISHEIRTPMNAVSGMSELLSRSTLKKEQKEFVSTIREAAQNLTELMNNVLDLSKIEAGKMDLIPENFEINQLVKNCIDLFALEAVNKKIKLSYKIAKGVPKHLHGDAIRIKQILINLLSNAIKFTEKGSVTLTVDLIKKEGNFALLNWAVEDTGLGISPEVAQRIFESFIQANHSIPKKFGGTGLGLAITKNLVEMMGSQIQVESTPNKGSKFWFNLNLMAVNNFQKAEPRKVKGDGTKRILVVEDIELNRKVAQRLLEELGFECKVAEDGLVAIEILKKESFDLIFMDCQMPNLNGFQTTEQIRKMEKSKKLHTPIIALTGNIRPQDKNRCFDSGMDDFLLKPIEIEKLEGKIHHWLGAVKVEKSPSKTESGNILSEEILDGNQFELLKKLSHKKDFIGELIQDFSYQIPTQLLELHKLKNQRDRRAFSQMAHAMKSSSGNMAAGAMFYSCKQLEKFGAAGNWKKVTLWLNRLEIQFQKTLTVLEQEKNKLEQTKAAA